MRLIADIPSRWRLVGGLVLGAVLLALLGLGFGLWAVRDDMMRFYRDQPLVACPDLVGDGMGDARHRQMAAANFYTAHVLGRSGVSPYSLAFRMRYLAVDVALARLYSGEQVREAARRAPCGYRRARGSRQA